jgi:alginate O-acetyltransferase complex protein AlgI
LRDYLYIFALGGSRRGRIREHVNLFITMLLGGLWHGPAWHFVAWGGMHGGALSVERLLGLRSERKSPLATSIWFVIVQTTVIMTWVVFRCPDIPTASRFLHSMFLASDLGSLRPELLVGLIFASPVLVHHLSWTLPSPIGDRIAAPLLRGFLSGMLALLSIVLDPGPRGFIYFNF